MLYTPPCTYCSLYRITSVRLVPRKENGKITTASHCSNDKGGEHERMSYNIKLACLRSTSKSRPQGTKFVLSKLKHSPFSIINYGVWGELLLVIIAAVSYSRCCYMTTGNYNKLLRLLFGSERSESIGEYQILKYAKLTFSCPFISSSVTDTGNRPRGLRCTDQMERVCMEKSCI